MDNDSLPAEDHKLISGAENKVFETPWIDFYYDDIVHSDGTDGKYSWVRSHSGNGAVMTVPVTPSGKFLIIKVWRYPSKRFLWEFPAGLIEDGETPVESGRRELIEETGIVPEDVVLLGSQIPIAGYVGDQFHSVLATIPEISIEDVIVQHEEGIMDARLMSRSELIGFLIEEIGEGTTLTSLARYWMWQELQGKKIQGEA